VAACTLPGTAYTALTGTVKPLLPGVVVNGDSRMKTADIGVPQQPSIDKTHGFTNNLRWHVSDELELRSITAWRGVDATQWDNSGGAHRVPVVTLTAACTAAAPCAFSRYSLADLKQDQFSQELQAVGTIGPVDYVAGLYYFNEHVEDDAATPSSNGAIATLNAAGQVTGATYVTIPYCTGQTVATSTAFIGSAARGCSIDRASEVHSKSYAAYGQATWNATDLLHITVGGRYTHDEKEGVLHISRNVNYDVNTAAATAAGYQPLDKTWDRFNPTATVAYDVTSTVHAYAKYATGYRSGGASSRTQNYQPFGPEDVKSYEIGLKSDLLDHRVRLNLAGYIMDRKNSQVDISSIQPFNGSSFNNLVTINAPGTTKIRGIEADLSVNPLEGLTLSASYAYTYTHIPLIPITYSAAGASTTVQQQFYIVYTPRNALSGTIDYALPLGDGDTKLRFHLDGNYAQATQAFDQFATKADSSWPTSRLGRATASASRLGRATCSTNSISSAAIRRTACPARRPPTSGPAASTTSSAIMATSTPRAPSASKARSSSRCY
jgi:iron complex outermembrane receptor protein